jgi:hypothetical protein
MHAKTYTTDHQQGELALEETNGVAWNMQS